VGLDYFQDVRKADREKFIEGLAQAAIAECNRKLPIKDAPRDGRNLVLWTQHDDGKSWHVPEIGHWDDEEENDWIDEIGEVIGAPTHFQNITRPEASDAE
jgi:hypothetical protein